MSTELLPGRIDIDSEVPAIMTDYEPTDMAQELWVWEFGTGVAATILPSGVLSSPDPKQVLKALKRYDFETDAGKCLRFGRLAKRSLSSLLEHWDVVIYTKFHREYTLIKRDPGEAKS